MDALGESPLHIAARAGDGSEVQRLLTAGAVVDAGNYRMYTPLHVAAEVAASDHGLTAASRRTNPPAPLLKPVAPDLGFRIWPRSAWPC